jgi:2'-5' RNA ligase
MDAAGMDCTLTKVETGQLFALIAFVPNELGGYLNRLRRQLVPGCPFKSHVTLLPPRLLGGSPSDLSGILHHRLRSIEACEVGLGEVEVFPATGVIYLGIESGGDVLRQIHALLSQDEFAGEETYPFHPHVTLAQDIPPLPSDELVERACSLWKNWEGERSFLLDRVSFVRGGDLGDWETVSEHDLNHSNRLRTV